MADLPDILKLTRLLHDFQKITRMIWVRAENRRENDVEHSYDLAMLAWYLASSRKLDLDIDLLLKYALLHDLVEVYAGDTPIYSKDAGHLESKSQREKDAAERLRTELPEFDELHALIERYERREDKESRFIYALDKIEPMLAIYDDGGRSWQTDGVTLAMLIEHKKDKVAVSPEVEGYFNELIELMRKEEKYLFSR
jgi:putative hydrolase of HD superfamily